MQPAFLAAARRRWIRLALRGVIQSTTLLACIDPATGPRATNTVEYTMILQQEYGGRYGRVYLFLRLNSLKARDPNFNCTGTIVTAQTETYLATVEAIPMRVQEGTTGNMVASS